MYTRDTVVVVEPFTRQPDGEDIIIGRVETGVFLAVPPEAVQVLEELEAGKSVGEVSDAYRDRHGEELDLGPFLGVLESKGIVRQAAGANPAETAGKASGPVKLRYHFSSFPQPLARALFSRPVLALGFAAIATALAAIAFDPSLAARPRDWYFPDHRTASIVILTAATYLALFLHELAHLVAARALGVNSRLGIGHRLWVLVVETDLTGLWSVPKRQRYLPLLAGVLVDAVSAAVLILALLANKRGWWPVSLFYTRLLRAAVFTYAMRIVWQFLLFVRTDLYFVVASAFSCKNLLGDTEVFLRNQAARFLRWIPAQNQSGIPPQERRVIHWFAWVWLAGRILALILLFGVTIPLTIRYVWNLGAVFQAGYAGHRSNFLDALLLACYILTPLFIGMWMWIRSLVRKKEGLT